MRVRRTAGVENALRRAAEIATCETTGDLDVPWRYLAYLEDHLYELLLDALATADPMGPDEWHADTELSSRVQRDMAREDA